MRESKIRLPLGGCASTENAIPLLESLLKDKGARLDLVRPPPAILASDELYWLRHPEKRRELLAKEFK